MALLEHYTPELITIEEFADRIGISRTTAFNWEKRGQLRAGRHYMQIGKTVRILWGPDLLNKLHEDSLQPTEQSKSEWKMKSQKPRSSSRGKALINIDY